MRTDESMGLRFPSGRLLSIKPTSPIAADITLMTLKIVAMMKISR